MAAFRQWHLPSPQQREASFAGRKRVHPVLAPRDPLLMQERNDHDG